MSLSLLHFSFLSGILSTPGHQPVCVPVGEEKINTMNNPSSVLVSK